MISTVLRDYSLKNVICNRKEIVVHRLSVVLQACAWFGVGGGIFVTYSTILTLQPRKSDTVTRLLVVL